jgi:hypothetical protein
VTASPFEIVDDRIRHIWAVRNPEKLGPWFGLRLDADLLSRAAESPADESSVRR